MKEDQFMSNKRLSVLFVSIVVLAFAVSILSGGQVEAKVLRVATVLPESNPSVVALFKFAEIVKEKTNGELDVQIFHHLLPGGKV